MSDIPLHWRQRVARLEAENSRLTDSVDALRASLADARLEITRSRIHALRLAAGIAKGFGDGAGDKQELTCETALKIHDAIVAEFVRHSE